MKKIKTTTYQFPVVIEQDEDGYFVADCPELQGCHAQGKTLEEAISNIRDAIKLHLKILKEEGFKNRQRRIFTTSEKVNLYRILACL